jgi:hypothetical protein
MTGVRFVPGKRDFSLLASSSGYRGLSGRGAKHLASSTEVKNVGTIPPLLWARGSVVG